VNRPTAPLVAALLVAFVSLVSARPAPDETERNRAIITAFGHRFYDGRDVSGAFARYAAPDYVQHNPGIGDGRAAAVADFYRLKDGRIVEHWDVIQPIAA